MHQDKKLNSIQKSIFTFLGDRGIQSHTDFLGLDLEERNVLIWPILKRIAGLGVLPSNLLDVQHVNAHFIGSDLLVNPQVKNKLNNLHKKTAIYTDHSIVCIPSVMLDRKNGYGNTLQNSDKYTSDIIRLFFQHKPMIETGKMSIVPSKVLRKGPSTSCLFDVEKLNTVKIDINDAEIHKAFIKDRLLFNHCGTLSFQVPESCGINLEDILEIEEKYNQEYTYFQTHLKNLMTSINPEDETAPMRAALKAVDEGIKELNVKYSTAKKSKVRDVHQFFASSAMSIGLYALDQEVGSFISAAISGVAASSLITFIPGSDNYPEEIRNSPFFIPWLVHNKEA